MAATVTYNDLEGCAPRVTWCGVSFLDGQPVFVEDDALIAKARGNRFFTVDDAPKAAIAALAPSFSTEPAPAPVDDEKAALIQELEGLGEHVDKRWSVETLMTKISEAKIKAAG